MQRKIRVLLPEEETVIAGETNTAAIAVGSRGAEFAGLKPTDTSRKGILGERNGTRISRGGGLETVYAAAWAPRRSHDGQGGDGPLALCFLFKVTVFIIIIIIIICPLSFDYRRFPITYP